MYNALDYTSFIMVKCCWWVKMSDFDADFTTFSRPSFDFGMLALPNVRD
jgi:hypothetical protein